MAPITRNGSKATRKPIKTSSRTHYNSSNNNNKLVSPKVNNKRTAALLEDSPSKSSTICTTTTTTTATTSPCSTPKAQRFRIPEIETCPPAPKKQRLIFSGCNSLQRTPIAFFAPPDLELFFFALRDVPI